MAKICAFFLVGLFLMSLFMAIQNQGGGVLATSLTDTIDADETTIPVDSTTGYLSNDYLYIGSEQIHYTGLTTASFTGCDRGYAGTDAAPHAEDSMVYTGATNAINSALGFNIGSVITSAGIFSIITIPYMFFTRSIPLMVTTAATLFSGSMFISFLGILWLILVAGFIITLAITISGAVSGLVARVT